MIKSVNTLVCKLASIKKGFRRTFCSLALLAFISLTGEAQDIQFSQFYANTLYLNPAFAGITPDTRLMFHQRVQWPSLDARYMTSMFALDHYFEKYKSGVGLMVLHDVQGASTISSSEVNFQYSYEIALSDKFSFRPGLQWGIASRYMNYAGLVYPDQYNDFGYTGSSQSHHENIRKNYIDFSSGGLFYSENLWVGFSIHHMNKPNQSFLQDNIRLPAKMALVGGYKITPGNNNRSFGEKLIFIPSFHYKLQGKSDQLDIGLYGLYTSGFLGIWYRGIPVKNYKSNLRNNESFVFLAGWKFTKVNMSYSFDVTISRLIKTASGGAHELNITYFFRQNKNAKKPMKKLPCPDLYRD